MGTDPVDDAAVVDDRLQVHGVDALHVVGASVCRPSSGLPPN
jgi:choline dehydrogenase-like flavoprotein